MLLQKMRVFWRFLLIPVCTNVLLLPAHTFCRANSHGGPSLQVVAMVGDDVILPCFLKPPPADASDLVLEWGRPDLTPGFIHVQRDNKEDDRYKQPSFVGRTSLSGDKLKDGDVSLKLYRVNISDEGTYVCRCPQLDQVSVVHLSVGSVSTPVIKVSSDDGSRLVLRCESAGWYPEPELFWLEGQGDLFSTGPTETVRGPDGLYNVSSRVIVVKRHSNFICRVQQKEIKQIRETLVYVADSSSHSSISKFLAVVFLVVVHAVPVD